MKIKNKFIISTIIIVSFCILSSVVLAVNLSQNEVNNEQISNDSAIQESKEVSSKTQTNLEDKDVKILTEKDVAKIISENDETYEQWEARMEGSSNKLSRKEELDLYNQGYDFYDIAVAEDLASLCNKTPQELLKLKGKTTFTTENGKIEEHSKSWNDIAKQLKIKIQKPTEALGLTDSQINEMKNQGLSNEEIEQAAVLSFNYKKDIKDILTDRKGGKSIKDLKKQYWKKWKEDSEKKSVSKEQAKENTEKLLKKQYGITDDDIKMCNDNGIKNIAEIAIAKNISKKNNVKLEKILKVKKNNKDWKSVDKEVGGK